MIQLFIPGLGLSPMQLAEEQLAKAIGLVVERRTLDREEAGAFGLSVDEALLPAIAEKASLDHLSATNPRPAAAADYLQLLRDAM